jgi:hypothetical protein
MSPRRAVPKPASTPSGGSAGAQRRSVGATMSPRRAVPKPASTPSGGSAGAQRRSVGAA